MRNILKFLFVLFVVFILVLLGIKAYKYSIDQTVLNSYNICQDDELIAKLIVENGNPFSKFKFIKKRNTDCKVLLIENKLKAEEYKSSQYCAFLEPATNSVTMLIYTYVNDMYDRESASKEFHAMVPLLTPYNYCPEYLDKMYTLVKLKKKLGL